MRNEILDYFRKANGQFISGEQISRDLHVSRTAIWKHINILKERGYIFESSTRKGYRLIYAPNLLTPLEIDSALHTETFGRHVVYLSSTTSTNEEAKKIAREGAGVWDYLATVWQAMVASIKRGLDEEGVLPGPLGVRRKAASYYIHAQGYNESVRSRGLTYAYALAVSEENAAGHLIVTAPTCGSCGVMPAVLYHLYNSKNFSTRRILRALATAGLFGNVVKTNASISGAEVGCQGEVGVACAMASAAATQLFGGSPAQIEYAAEMGLEHHLGLTCDPMCGMVQIPCIERKLRLPASAGVQAARIRVLLKRLTIAVRFRLCLPLLLVVGAADLRGFGFQI